MNSKEKAEVDDSWFQAPQVRDALEREKREMYVLLVSIKCVLLW